ncbi:MAG TPA: hypothetical protein DIS88_07030 [Prevotella sp.]|nr:hypothetical protein [Prevotella sp.]
MKKILCVAFFGIMSLTGFAQSGTNSPYSQYGLGILSEQSSGFNRGMNGLGLGFHEHNQVNYLNPASYSAIDSLTFIFDAGISGQITNFSENGTKLNANNGNFEYVVAGFRAFRHVGVSFGLVPLTNVGYNYSSTNYIDEGKKATYTNAYSGDGGFHQVYLGAGWEPFKGFSFGANFGYLWGTENRSLVTSFSETYANTLSKYYTVDVRSYNLNVGAQYTAKLSKKDALTVGATYTMGHKLHSDPELQVISTNSETSVSDTTTFTVKNGLEIPHIYSAGFMYNHNDQLKFGVDYSLQKWAKIDFPQYSVVNNVPQYALKSGLYKDRQKVTVGAELCPSAYGRNFFGRIHYRAGVSYATPYIKINGQDGPKEISASLGFGIPIMNQFNNRSILNISAQWVHQSAKDLITENTFRINIGITFNEGWFAKWKVQ